MRVHTGQHHDKKLSEVFLAQMGIPEPDFNLDVGSGSQAAQTAEILKRIEPVLLEQKLDLVLVVGDVNSTVAASLARKAGDSHSPCGGWSSQLRPLHAGRD